MYLPFFNKLVVETILKTVMELSNIKWIEADAAKTIWAQ